MLFTDLNQYIVLGLLLFVGWLFGFASHSGGAKWRKRLDQESDAYSSYRFETDGQLRDSTRRIAELEASLSATNAQLADARAAAAPPVHEPEPVHVAEVVHAPEPEPVHHPEPFVAHEPVHVEVAHPEPVHEAPVHEEPPHQDRAAEDMTRLDFAAHQPIVHEPAPEPAHESAHVEPAAAEPVADHAPWGQHDAAPAAPVAHHEPSPAPAMEPFFVEAEPAAPAPAAEDPSKGWFDNAGRNHLARIKGIDGYMQSRLEGLGVKDFADVEKLSAEDEMALEQRLEIPAGYIAREQWRDQAALLRAGNDEEHRQRFPQG